MKEKSEHNYCITKQVQKKKMHFSGIFHYVNFKAKYIWSVKGAKDQ